MKRFGFTDSSGIIRSDQFFGTGLLIVKNVGDMADKLNKNSQPARALVKESKNKKIEQLIAQNKKDEVITILKNNSRFEMKFDNVRSSNLEHYGRMIDIFLSDSDNRFSAMIVDKHNSNFDGDGIEDIWETYTKYIASLVVKEMKHLPGDEICLVVDEISRPREKPLSLEDTLLSKIREEVIKDGSLDFNSVYGALSIESHSNFLMQLCDVLLGAVMYDYKKKYGLASAKTQLKKEALVQKIRGAVGAQTLAQEFTANPTAYFNVSECL